MKNRTSHSLQSSLWRSTLKSRAAKLSAWLIGLLLFVAIAGDFIANDKPIYGKIDGKAYYPIFNAYGQSLGICSPVHPRLGTDWHDFTYERALWPIIPFTGNGLDLENIYRSPFSSAKKNNRFTHLLGTGLLGKDVAAGLVEGTRIALMVGILAILLAALIGLLIGGIAGFFGDHYFRLSWLRIIALILGLIFGIYYAHLCFQIYTVDQPSIFIGLLTLLGSLMAGLLVSSFIYLMAYIVERLLKLKTRQAVPTDLLLMRLIEIVNSLPALLILLVVAGMFETRSIWIVIFIIAFIKWTTIAKFIRGELLRIRALAYIQAARASGAKEWKILWSHAIPNALTPVFITIAFGIASAILLEATISFLGIGIEQDIMSWGKMLAQARQKPSAWWLAIFPGIMVFICVIAFNILGDKIRESTAR